MRKKAKETMTTKRHNIAQEKDIIDQGKTESGVENMRS